MKKKNLFALLGIGITLVILVLLIFASPRFYRRTHSYPEYFSMFSSCGVADKEAVEFKMLNDRYGTPGNPCITHGDNMVGVWVLYPLTNSTRYLQLVLEKDLISSNINFYAQYCAKEVNDLPDTGNPDITMQLPLSLFNDIICSGVPVEVQKRFEKTAIDSNWQTVGTNEYIPLPRIELTMEEKF